MTSEHLCPVLKIFSRFTFPHIHVKIPKILITYMVIWVLHSLYHSPFIQLAPDVMASGLCLQHPRILPSLAILSASLKPPPTLKFSFKNINPGYPT